MCSIVLLIRPGHRWPLVLAANRDERVDRPWDPPGSYWPELPGVIAGRDRLAGGTWMGVNAEGVVAAILNRPDSLGPAPGKASRGGLPLRALGHATAAAAAADIAALPGSEYRSFNMFVSDARETFWLANPGSGPIAPRPLAPGLWMASAHDPNDLSAPRIARHLPRFRAAPPPDPDRGEWEAWRAILGDRSGSAESRLTIPETAGFATVSASLLALPAAGPARWLFAAGPADVAPFRQVSPAR